MRRHIVSLLALPAAVLAPLAGVCPAAAAAPSLMAAHPAAMPSGEAYHWGAYFGGGGHARAKVPAAITLPGPVAEVGTSNSNGYALLANGTLWAWGLGADGELGNGGTANSFTSAVQVRFPAGVSIAWIPTDANPFDSAYAVDTTGHVWAWGLNQGGELCLRNTTQQTVPQEIPGLTVVTGRGLSPVAGADNHGIFYGTYKGSTGVWSCGNSVLGTKSGKARYSPGAVPAFAGERVTAVTASGNNGGVLLAAGTFWDWGTNPFGQLGDGTTTASKVPVQAVLPDTSPIVQAAQGGSENSTNGQVLVMLADGTYWAWGNDTWGQLGDGGTDSEPSPVQFFPPQGVTYVTLASGGSTSYAIDSAGNVWAWGDGAQGQLGNGGTASSGTPAEVETGASLISSTANNTVVAG